MAQIGGHGARILRDWVADFSGGWGSGFCGPLKGKGAGSAWPLGREQCEEFEPVAVTHAEADDAADP